MKCPKCQSENFKLESRTGEPIETANQVALICADCGRWIKWCPRNERHLYMPKELTTAEKLLWLVTRYGIKSIYLGGARIIEICNTTNLNELWKYVHGRSLEEAINAAYDWAIAEKSKERKNG